MVHFRLVATHMDTVDAIESCAIYKMSWNRNEVGIFADWRNRHRNYVKPVIADEPYGLALGVHKGKEFQEELWCTRWRTNGHHKDNFPVVMNYVVVGMPIPLNTQGIPWCQVFQTRCHKFEECLYLQKIVSAPASLYCKFCRSVGHDEKQCIAFQLLQEKMMDTYLMKNDE